MTQYPDHVRIQYGWSRQVIKVLIDHQKYRITVSTRLPGQFEIERLRRDVGLFGQWSFFASELTIEAAIDLIVDYEADKQRKNDELADHIRESQEAIAAAQQQMTTFRPDLR